MNFRFTLPGFALKSPKLTNKLHQVSLKFEFKLTYVFAPLIWLRQAYRDSRSGVQEACVANRVLRQLPGLLTHGKPMVLEPKIEDKGVSYDY